MTIDWGKLLAEATAAGLAALGRNPMEVAIDVMKGAQVVFAPGSEAALLAKAEELMLSGAEGVHTAIHWIATTLGVPPPPPPEGMEWSATMQQYVAIKEVGGDGESIDQSGSGDVTPL